MYICNLLCTYAIYCVRMQFIVYICNLLCIYAIYCVRMQFIVYIRNLLCMYAICLQKHLPNCLLVRTVIISFDVYVTLQSHFELQSMNSITKQAKLSTKTVCYFRKLWCLIVQAKRLNVFNVPVSIYLISSLL